MFDWIEPLISALVLAGYGLIFGAVVGALLMHALQRGQRDFHSILGLRPKCYDVVADVRRNSSPAATERNRRWRQR